MKLGKFVTQVVALTLAVVLLSGCSAVFPTATPYPTYTPFPTQTPNPTYTSVPPTPTSTATLVPSPTRPPTASPTPTLSPTSPSTPTPAISSTPLPPPRRMLNGFFLAPKPRGNYGYITVTNPLQLDAVFVLVQDKVLLTAVYIQGGNDFKIEAMPLGTFTGYYVLGEDWNHSERQFTRKVEYHRWTESLAFTETTSPGWIWYKQYSIALVAGSADSTKPIVSADSFPALPK